MHRRLFAALSCFTALTSAHGATIDFNELPAGPIDGTGIYKYWTVTRSNFDGGSFTATMIVNSESTGSANKVLAATAPSVVSRVSGPGFDFPAPTAPNSVLELQYDMRTRVKFGQTVAWVGFETDANQDGGIAGATEMRLGISYYMGQFLATHRSYDKHDNGAPLGQPASTFAVNEWIRVKLIVDFEANSGDGTARLETMNLSKGETAFQPASGSGVALGENTFPTLHERLWNGIFVGLNQDCDIDNISVRLIGADTSAEVVNLSNRIFLAPGRTAFGGFVTAGGTKRKLLIRAIGKGLQQFGVEERVEDPLATLYRGGVEIRKIERPKTPNEAQTLRAAVTETGAFPVEGTTDVQEVVELEAGAYTFAVRSASGQPGEILIEIYSLPE